MLDGKKVQEARKALGLDQRTLAKLVGISTTTLCKIEKDDYPPIKLKVARDIAWHVRKPLCELLKEPYERHNHGESGPAEKE